jgi:hypothetical protein
LHIELIRRQRAISLEGLKGILKTVFVLRVALSIQHYQQRRVAYA